MVRNFMLYSRWLVKLDDIFSITTLFNFVSSSIVICTIGFLVIYSNKIAEVMRFAFCLVTCVMQIFILCWLGDRVIENVLSRSKFLWLHFPF